MQTGATILCTVSDVLESIKNVKLALTVIIQVACLGYDILFHRNYRRLLLVSEQRHDNLADVTGKYLHTYYSTISYLKLDEIMIDLMYIVVNSV